MNNILTLLSQAIIDSGLLVLLKFVLKICTGKARFSTMASSYSFGHITIYVIIGECIALWGEPNELSIQHCAYIFMKCVDSKLA